MDLVRYGSVIVAACHPRPAACQQLANSLSRPRQRLGGPATTRSAGTGPIAELHHKVYRMCDRGQLPWPDYHIGLCGTAVYAFPNGPGNGKAVLDEAWTLRIQKEGIF